MFVDRLMSHRYEEPSHTGKLVRSVTTNIQQNYWNVKLRLQEYFSLISRQVWDIQTSQMYEYVLNPAAHKIKFAPHQYRPTVSGYVCTYTAHLWVFFRERGADGVSLCISGCPKTHNNPPASASWAQGLQACSPKPCSLHILNASK